MQETIFSTRNTIGKVTSITTRIGHLQDRCITPHILRQVTQVRIMSNELGTPIRLKDHIKGRQSTMVRCLHPKDSAPICMMGRMFSLTQGNRRCRAARLQTGNLLGGQIITYPRSGLMKVRLPADRKSKLILPANAQSPLLMIGTQRLWI